MRLAGMSLTKKEKQGREEEVKSVSHAQFKLFDLCEEGSGDVSEILSPTASIDTGSR